MVLMARDVIISRNLHSHSHQKPMPIFTAAPTNNLGGIRSDNSDAGERVKNGETLAVLLLGMGFLLKGQVALCVLNCFM